MSILGYAPLWFVGAGVPGTGFAAALPVKKKKKRRKRKPATPDPHSKEPGR